MLQRSPIGISIGKNNIGFAIILEGQDAVTSSISVLPLDDIRDVSEKVDRAIGELTQITSRHDRVWVVGVQSSNVFEARSAADKERSRKLTELHDVFFHEVRKSFGADNLCNVSSKAARRHLGILSVGDEARNSAFELCKEHVGDSLPAVTLPKGGLCESSYVGSDSWVIANYVHFSELMERVKRDPLALERLRLEVTGSKHIKQMHQSVVDAKSRRISREIEAVMQNRVEKLIDAKLAKEISAQLKLQSSSK